VLVAAAVCPHPPLLVPEAMGAAGLRPAAALGDTELARPAVSFHDHGESGRPEPVTPSVIMKPGSDAQISALRAACTAAVASLAAARPDLVAVVGGAGQTAVYQASAAGSLRDFGVPFTTGSGQPVLPLSLTIGGWLVRRLLTAEAGREPWRVRLQAVRQSMPAAQCQRMGAQLASAALRVALLVMGDGSARKAIGVPGAPDPAAERYDTEVAAALADADPGRLARLDASLDRELMVAGRAAWQVLAGAAEGCRLRGQLRFAGAPLGVSYLVASWAS
jgi:hypothetical protein